MLLRISTLATGRTGIRPETLDAYVAMLNAGITPVVREYGSLGCSGDLAPLAHCALALMGEGEVVDAAGHLTNAENALRAAGIDPTRRGETLDITAFAALAEVLQPVAADETAAPTPPTSQEQS